MAGVAPLLRHTVSRGCAAYGVRQTLCAVDIRCLFAPEIYSDCAGLGRKHLEATEFVVFTEALYGKQEMTSNVDTVLHLPKGVPLHGPLWAHSCFPFECNVGRLLNLASAAKGMPLQIASRVTLQTNLHLLKSMAADSIKCQRGQIPWLEELELLL